MSFYPHALLSQLRAPPKVRNESKADIRHNRIALAVPALFDTFSSPLEHDEEMKVVGSKHQ
jgi:hypothetical protein